MSNRDKRAQQRPRSRRAQIVTPREPQICIYCQEREADTVEHVIAKCFFGRMQPRRNVKVPACRECNGGRGDGGTVPMTMDEEYVRTVLAHEHNSAQHPVAAALLINEVSRSFDNSPALLRRIGANMRLIDARTEQGVIIPDVPAMTVEGHRVARVIQKIVRGLFHAVNGWALPPKWPIHVTNKLTAKQFRDVNGMMDLWKRNTGWWNIGDEKAFRFKCAMKSPESKASIWLVVFYNAVAFCCHTMPIDPQTGKAMPVADEPTTPQGAE